VRELGLAGAHVSARANVSEVRALLPPGALLGASRHEGDALDEKALTSVDYVTLSPIFQPLSKVAARAPLGVDSLSRACAASRTTPLVALGGIDHRNARACRGAGAPAVAVIGAVMASHDPRRALSALCCPP
jgi:thiamine-phosphate pyrophosphorylase